MLAHSEQGALGDDRGDDLGLLAGEAALDVEHRAAAIHVFQDHGVDGLVLLGVDHDLDLSRAEDQRLFHRDRVDQDHQQAVENLLGGEEGDLRQEDQRLGHVDQRGDGEAELFIEDHGKDVRSAGGGPGPDDDADAQAEGEAGIDHVQHDVVRQRQIGPAHAGHQGEEQRVGHGGEQGGEEELLAQEDQADQQEQHAEAPDEDVQRDVGENGVSGQGKTGDAAGDDAAGHDEMRRADREDKIAEQDLQNLQYLFLQVQSPLSFPETTGKRLAGPASAGIRGAGPAQAVFYYNSAPPVCQVRAS